MAGFVDSLVISIGLDSSKVEQGLQQIGTTLDAGVRAAVEGASPAIEALAENFQTAAEEAEGLAEAATGAGEAAAEAGAAGIAAGKKGEKAAKGVTREVREAAQTMQRELPRAAQQAASGIETALGRVKEGFKGFIAQIIGPLAGTFAIGGAISTFINGAAAAEEAGQAFNVSAEELQLWQGAITRAGGNVGRFEMTLRKMTMSGKSAGDALKTLHDLAGQAEKMSRESFTAKAKEMGIDVATIGVLVQGQKALDAHLRRAKEIGIYEKRHIEQAKRLKIGLWELSGAFDGLKNELLLMVLPAMEKLSAALTDLTLYLSAHPEMVAAALTAIGVALSAKLLPPLAKLPALIRTIGASMMRWMPFIAIVMAIAAVVDDFIIYLEGGDSALEDFWAIFGTGKEISAALSQAWKDLKQTGSEIWDGLTAKVRAFWATLRDWGVLDGLKTALLGLGHVIHGFFTDNWEEAVQGAKDIFGGLYDAIAGPISAGLAYVGALFSTMWADFKKGTSDALAAAWNTFMNWLGSLLETARNWIVEKVNGILGSIKIPGFIKNMFGGADEETEKAGGKMESGMKDTAGGIKKGFDAVWNATSRFAVEKFRSASNAIRTQFGSMLTELSAQADSFSAGAGAMALRMPAGAPARAGAQAHAARPGNTDASVHIGTMNVQTQARDADGVARDMGGALKRHRLTSPAATGTPVK